MPVPVEAARQPGPVEPFYWGRGLAGPLNDLGPFLPFKVGGWVRKLRGKKVVSRAPLAARAGPSASPRASCEASAGPKPAQTAPMGLYQQARHLLRLLERVLKVLGWLTTPDWQVGQHQLQVRGFDGAQQEQAGASARLHRAARCNRAGPCND